MKRLIKTYLLLKCASGRVLTHLDSMIALAIVECELTNAPEWLQAIANMEQEAELIEAWQLFLDGLQSDVERWLDLRIRTVERIVETVDRRLEEWLR